MSDALNRSVAPFCHSQDRPGGVHVAVGNQTAVRAHEGAFVQQKAVLGSRPASAARHCRVGGLHQPATCLLCPLLDACRAAIDAMEPVWGTQDTIWAGETPGQRKRRREAGGTVHRPRKVHVVPGPEAGDWLTTRIQNARRKGWL